MVLITPEQVCFFLLRLNGGSHIELTYYVLILTNKVLSQGYDPVIVGIADPLTSI